MSYPKANQDNFRLQQFVLVLGIVLMVAKFIVYFLTRSNTIFTDALESIINVLAAGFALYSLHLSAIPKDINHPYGHGKIEFLSATLEGALIFLAGVIIIVKSVYNLLYPQRIAQIEYGILVVVIAGLINYIAGRYSVKKGRRTKNVVLEAGGKHLQADAYSAVGLLLGLIAIKLTHFVWLDSTVAIIFGGIITFAGYKILRTSVAGIMDEADIQLLHEIVDLLNKNRRPDWVDIHNLRVIKYGSTLHIDCHLTVPWYLTVEQAHKEVSAVEQLINSHFENNVEIFVHVDPCEPSSCPICEKPDCPHRQKDFAKKVDWTFENVIENKKHTYSEQ